jgi:hypothetical protein
MQRHVIQNRLSCHHALGQISSRSTITSFFYHPRPCDMHDMQNEMCIHFEFPKSKHELKQFSRRTISFVVDGLCSGIVGEQENFCSYNPASFDLLFQPIHQIL